MYSKEETEGLRKNGEVRKKFCVSGKTQRTDGGMSGSENEADTQAGQVWTGS